MKIKARFVLVNEMEFDSAEIEEYRAQCEDETLKASKKLDAKTISAILLDQWSQGAFSWQCSPDDQRVEVVVDGKTGVASILDEG